MIVGIVFSRWQKIDSDSSDVMSAVMSPDPRSDHWERSSANCWQFKWWHHQAVSASRANRLSTSQIGDTNNRSEILRCDLMQNLER